MALGYDPNTGQPYDDSPYQTFLDGPVAQPAPGPQQTQPRYNTTGNWQDPFNPPSPGDPYWAEWIAANPTYRGQGYNGPVGPTPTLTDGGGGGGATGGAGTIGGLLAPFTGTFNQPAPLYPGATGTGVPETPVFNAPAYQKPPAFSYDAFSAPSYQDAQSDPGFQFGLGQSLQALEQRKASRGSLNTGGTIKGLIDYARNAADQQYGSVYGRQLQTYNTNRNNAADIYATNAQTQYLQPYAAAYQSAVDSFQPQMAAYQTNAAANQRGNENNTNSIWDQYLNTQDLWKDQRDSTFSKLFSYLQL